jgi:hypothetical protein
LTSFPAAFIKNNINSLQLMSVADNFIQHQLFDSIPSRAQQIPLDNRPSPPQVYAYETYLTVNKPGNGESMFLTGLYRCSENQVVDRTVTIGVDTYLVVACSPLNQFGGPIMLVGPLGTTI